MRDVIAEFEFERQDDVLVAKVVGEIDRSNSRELRLALIERLSTDAQALVVDLSRLAYLDSSGVQLLFELARGLAARRQAIRLVVPAAAPVRRVLELCAVEGVAPMDDELSDSLKELAATEP